MVLRLTSSQSATGFFTVPEALLTDRNEGAGFFTALTAMQAALAFLSVPVQSRKKSNEIKEGKEEGEGWAIVGGNVLE